MEYINEKAKQYVNIKSYVKFIESYGGIKNINEADRKQIIRGVVLEQYSEENPAFYTG